MSKNLYYQVVRKGMLPLLCLAGLVGCFQPVAYLRNKRNYPVDVFYDNQRPERPFEPLQDLEVKGEVPLKNHQSADRRMIDRGNDMEQKDLMLARLTMQAKKLGADALVDVKYTYYTSINDNGYVMKGLAVKWKREVDTTQK
ncbi:hypothetical protein GCM10027592_43910 [Spirosoma flavus]